MLSALNLIVTGRRPRWRYENVECDRWPWFGLLFAYGAPQYAGKQYNQTVVSCRTHRTQLTLGWGRVLPRGRHGSPGPISMCPVSSWAGVVCARLAVLVRGWSVQGEARTGPQEKNLDPRNCRFFPLTIPLPSQGRPCGLARAIGTRGHMLEWVDVTSLRSNTFQNSKWAMSIHINEHALLYSSVLVWGLAQMVHCLVNDKVHGLSARKQTSDVRQICIYMNRLVYSLARYIAVSVYSKSTYETSSWCTVMR